VTGSRAFQCRAAVVLALLLMLAPGGCSSRRKKPPAKAAAAKISSTQPAQPIPKRLHDLLARWNAYRSAVGLPLVGPDTQLDQAAWLHCRYLVKNQVRGADAIFSRVSGGTRANLDLHDETRGNKWYSEEGNKWAAQSRVRAGDAPLDPDGIIDRVMTTGFTAMNFLNPQLDSVGVGEYCENNLCAEAIILDEGISRQQLLALYEDGEWLSRVPKAGRSEFVRARLKKPLTFPADDMRIDAASYQGDGVPDPLTSCPGYSAPSGPVLFLEMGKPAASPDVTATAVSLTDNGAEVETCAIDGTNYRNPSASLEHVGRWDLFYYGAVIIVPRHPLQPGHTYIVSVTAEGRPHSWTFTVAPGAK
jgi:hypothetical protein